MSSLEDKPTIHMATLLGVIEQGEGYPVELWANGKGKVFVRAYNESGQSVTDTPVVELWEALRGVDG